MNKLYLKSSVVVEPLVNNWYAWPYLVSPATACRYISITHKRLMESFIADAELHIMAANDPSLVGGEFVNCRSNQVEDINCLLAKLDRELLDVVSLSAAIEQLEALLRQHTSGESIEYLYPLVPPALKGLIEITLDSEHRTGYRFIESLVYKSEHYREDLQSVCFSINQKPEDRSFVFSTPRLADETNLHIEIDFKNEDLDTIFKSREVGVSEEILASIFEKYKIKGGLSWRVLFSRDKRSHYVPTTGVRVQYTGHAGFLVETKETSLLVDPLISNDTDSADSECLSYKDLPSTIDAILITHNHADHFNIESLLQLRYKTNQVIVPRNNGGTLMDPSIKHILVVLGFSVIEVDDLDSLKINNVNITAIPFIGEHGDLNIRSKTAWLLDVQEEKIFFGADCANPEPKMFERIKSAVGTIDLLCIGMECVGAPYTWSYGALHTAPVSRKIKESRRLNGSDSIQASNIVDVFKPRQVAIYALGLEKCYKYLMGLEYEDDSKQILESRKFISNFGQSDIAFTLMEGRHKFEFNN